MPQKLTIHPQNPQPRLIQQAVKIIQEGGVIVYPTDSAYALGCHLGDKAASERIRQIRQLDKHHHFTLVCCDLSQLSTYARVDNPTFRLLKAHTPGRYTLFLKRLKRCRGGYYTLAAGLSVSEFRTIRLPRHYCWR